MPKNPPDGMPRITPYLVYKDLPSALAWLEKTFGFKPRFSMPGKDGKLLHAEMTFADGVIMMGPGNQQQKCVSPVELPGLHQSLYVYVDDVDAHHAHSKASGAEVFMELQDMFWGDRTYAVKDLEGHAWTFATHVKDVPPEEMKLPEDW